MVLCNVPPPPTCLSKLTNQHRVRPKAILCARGCICLSFLCKRISDHAPLLLNLKGLIEALPLSKDGDTDLKEPSTLLKEILSDSFALCGKSSLTRTHSLKRWPDICETLSSTLWSQHYTSITWINIFHGTHPLDNSFKTVLKRTVLAYGSRSEVRYMSLRFERWWHYSSYMEHAQTSSGFHFLELCFSLEWQICDTVWIRRRRPGLPWHFQSFTWSWAPKIRLALLRDQRS